MAFICLEPPPDDVRHASRCRCSIAFPSAAKVSGRASTGHAAQIRRTARGQYARPGPRHGDEALPRAQRCPQGTVQHHRRPAAAPVCATPEADRVQMGLPQPSELSMLPTGEQFVAGPTPWSYRPKAFPLALRSGGSFLITPRASSIIPPLPPAPPDPRPGGRRFRRGAQRALHANWPRTSIEVVGARPIPTSHATESSNSTPTCSPWMSKCPAWTASPSSASSCSIIPCPSSWSVRSPPQGTRTAVEALEAGAVDVLGKPGSSYRVGDLSADLMAKVKLAAGTRVIARPAGDRSRRRHVRAPPPAWPPPPKKSWPSAPPPAACRP